MRNMPTLPRTTPGAVLEAGHTLPPLLFNGLEDSRGSVTSSDFQGGEE